MANLEKGVFLGPPCVLGSIGHGARRHDFNINLIKKNLNNVKLNLANIG